MLRRSFVAGALAAPFLPRLAAHAGEELYIADMHAHLFFVGPKPASVQPLARSMSAGNVSLLSWSLVGDMPWLKPVKGGFKQSGAPGEKDGLKWLEEEVGRAKAHLDEQGLKLALEPADIDRALLGDPRVVLSIEGATFLDDGLDTLAAAHGLGVRHVQLVHFIRNTLGDMQTEPPTHAGLTQRGREAIAECNRLGILVDLAHCPGPSIAQALEAAKVPVVWSHSSVTRDGDPSWKMSAWRARQLSLAQAKSIADKGGVIGVWALGGDVGKTPDSYAARVAEIAGMIGDEHVAFGTDLNALGSPALSSYADLHRAARRLVALGLEKDAVRRIAIENYARVLKAAMQARTA